MQIQSPSQNLLKILPITAPRAIHCVPTTGLNDGYGVCALQRPIVFQIIGRRFVLCQYKDSINLVYTGPKSKVCYYLVGTKLSKHEWATDVAWAPAELSSEYKGWT